MQQRYNHFRAQKPIKLNGFLEKYLETIGPVIQSNCAAYIITNQELTPNHSRHGKLNGVRIKPIFSRSHTKPTTPLKEFIDSNHHIDNLSQLMLLFETRISPEVYTCNCGEGVSAIYLSELHKNPIVSIPKRGEAKYTTRGIENTVGKLKLTTDPVYIPRLKII